MSEGRGGLGRSRLRTIWMHATMNVDRQIRASCRTEELSLRRSGAWSVSLKGRLGLSGIAAPIMAFVLAVSFPPWARGVERYQCGTHLPGTIGEVVLSPGGNELAELMQSRVSHCAAQWIRVGPLEGGKRRWRTVLRGRGVSTLHWVDDGHLAFLQGRGGDTISSVDVASSRVTALVQSPGPIVSYSVDPSGKRIAYAYRIWPNATDYVSRSIPDRVAVPWVVLPNWATAYKQFSGNGAGSTGIGIATIGIGDSRKAYFTHLNVYQLLWAGKAERPMVLRQANQSGIWQMSLVDLYAGESVVGPPRFGGISRAAASSSGLLAIAASGAVDGRYSPAEPKVLFVVDNSRRVHRVSAVTGRSISNIWWDRDGTIWAQVQSEDLGGGAKTQRLVKVDWRKNKVLRTISWPNGNLEDCQLDRRREVGICFAETLTSSPQLIRVELRSGAMSNVSGADYPVERMSSPFREIRVRNRFGQSTTGFLFFPADAAGAHARQVPLAIVLYGFMRVFSKDAQWIRAYPVDRLVRAGIAVLLLNVPEVTGWRLGDPVSARSQLLDAPLATIEQAPNAVEESGLKVGKMMVMGWSSGGFLAAQIIGRSCRFVAAEVGDPAAWNITGYALGNAAWRGFANSVFGGPPDAQYAKNYLDFDPAGSGRPPAGPILLEYVSRNLDAGQYLEEWRATGAYVEAFAYHYSVHMLNVPAEAKLSRERNLAWAQLNLLGPASVSASTLRRLGLAVPPASSYRCAGAAASGRAMN